MTQDGRWVRPAYLSLAAIAGLIVMMWGLVTGALGGFHIYQPRYARAESDQGDVAAAFSAVYSPILQIGQSNGTAPPNAKDQLDQAVAVAQSEALQRAKDRGYNEAVKGALAFVVGGFVFLVGSSGAKRAGNRMGQPSVMAGSTPNPVPASPMPRPAAPQQQAGSGSAQEHPVPAAPARPSAVASSPVGRLQEAPESRRSRKAPPPPKPAPKRAPEPPTQSPAPRQSIPAPQPAPAPPPAARPLAPPPPRPAEPAPGPAAPSAPPASGPAPSQPVTSPPPSPPFRPVSAPTQPLPPPPVARPIAPPPTQPNATPDKGDASE